MLAKQPQFLVYQMGMIHRAVLLKKVPSRAWLPRSSQQLLGPHHILSSFFLSVATRAIHLMQVETPWHRTVPPNCSNIYLWECLWGLQSQRANPIAWCSGILYSGNLWGLTSWRDWARYPVQESCRILPWATLGWAEVAKLQTIAHTE